MSQLLHMLHMLLLLHIAQLLQMSRLVHMLQYYVLFYFQPVGSAAKFSRIRQTLKIYVV